MKRLKWLAGASLALALGWWWVYGDSAAVSTAQKGNSVKTDAANGLPAPGAALSTETMLVSGTIRRSAEQWENWLFTHSSLKGASLDGDWGEMGARGLQPSLGLRHRFDQLLTTNGELNLTEIRAMVQALAERDLGSDAATVMAAWDRYETLRKTPPRTQPDSKDLQTWLLLLQEQQTLRRQILGEEWATAFFAEDEKYFVAAVQRAIEHQREPKPIPPELWEGPPAGVSAERWHENRQKNLGKEAAERLAALDKQQAEWEQRINIARQMQAALTKRPELSEIQRTQDLERWVADRFFGTEQIRARALLGL
jgi:lipase chaperone LimK